MNKGFVALALLVLVVIAGCARAPIKAPGADLPASTADAASSIDQDVADVDAMQQDLDTSDVDSLDQDLNSVQ
jgi:hypothetical protein